MVVMLRVPPEWTLTDAQARVQDVLEQQDRTAWMRPRVKYPVQYTPEDGSDLPLAS